jgi:hypothetical protein
MQLDEHRPDSIAAMRRAAHRDPDTGYVFVWPFAELLSETVDFPPESYESLSWQARQVPGSALFRSIVEKVPILDEVGSELNKFWESATHGMSQLLKLALVHRLSPPHRYWPAIRPRPPRWQHAASHSGGPRELTIPSGCPRGCARRR